MKAIWAQLAALLVVLGMATVPVAAEPAEGAMRSVIERQLEAFQRDDWDEAFSYASPSIRRIFGNAQRFSQMVTGGYPMVWRPGKVTFSTLRNTAKGWVQTVIFRDQAGVDHIADYFMQKVDGDWLINGVSIRKASGVGA